MTKKMMHPNDVKQLIEEYGAFIKNVSQMYTIVYMDGQGKAIEDEPRKTALTGCFLRELSQHVEKYWYVLDEFARIPQIESVSIVLREIPEGFLNNHIGCAVTIVGVFHGGEVSARPSREDGTIRLPDSTEYDYFIFSGCPKDMISHEVWCFLNPEIRARVKTYKELGNIQEK
jgi:hypothetical protein